ncbi:MAG: hypothetical protein Q8S73_10680 [Deltaproteobacteria bacterium]|nr:hypothetical protein [Deltaproteobacteria bacterium]
MSVPSACPHCQQPLPEGFIGKACPHCRGALANKRKRSLSGFSFQAMQPGAAGSSRPPHAANSSTPPRALVEDRWDLPDLGADAPRERGAVPPAAPTGFPAVPSAMTAQMLRSTMALGVQVPPAGPNPGPPAPAASPVAPPGASSIRSTAVLDPFAWNLDHASPPAPAARNSALDVRALKQTALGVSPQPAPRPQGTATGLGPASAALRKTALGVAPLPAAPAVPSQFEVPDDLPEADAFPLVRSSHPPPAARSTRPPPHIDPVAAMADEIDIPSGPVAALDFELDAANLEESGLRASALPAYAPFRAPPSRRPGPVAPVAWWWSIGGAALVLSAVVVLRSAPFAVALRAAAAVASLLMLARFGGLAMRALLLLLVALPALAQEALSVTTLSRVGAAVLTGALVLLSGGAWLSGARPVTRRALLSAGVALAVAAALMPGGVGLPWALGAAPVLVLALAALVSPARWVTVSLTAALMAWALVCGIGGRLALPTAATGLAMATLVLLCGRALAAVIESDEG